MKDPPAQYVNQQSGNLLAEDSENLMTTTTGLPTPHFTQRGKTHYKQVLFNNSGFAKPTELVAILGPSGAGKTSLLNVLSQRTNLNKGSITEGSISVNDRELLVGDFGKIGAFVQ